MNGTVLVDTNVFTAPLRADRPLQAQYRKHTFGRQIAVAPQSVAEAKHGALTGGWGTRRLNELARLSAGVRVCRLTTRRSSLWRSFETSVE